MSVRGGAALLIVIAIAGLALLATWSDLGGQHRDALAEAAANSPDRSQSASAPLDPAAMALEQQSRAITIEDLPDNRSAPDPRLLAGRPDLQEAFDEKAQPGEFVTPPGVSVGSE